MPARVMLVACVSPSRVQQIETALRPFSHADDRRAWPELFSTLAVYLAGFLVPNFFAALVRQREQHTLPSLSRVPNVTSFISRTLLSGALVPHQDPHVCDLP